MVDRMDWNIGRVIDYLADTGELDDTVVIFLSDNGAEGAIVEAMPLRGAQIVAQIEKYCDNSLDNLGRPHLVHLVRPALGTSRHGAVAPAQGVHHRGRDPGGRLRHLAGLRPAGRDRHGVRDRHGHRPDRAGTRRRRTSRHRLPRPRSRTHARPLAGAVSVGRHRGGARRRHRHRLGVVRPPRHPPGRLEGAATCPRRTARAPGSSTTFPRDPGEIDDLAASHPDKLAELLALWDRYVEETGVILEPVSVFDVDPRTLN